MNPKGILEADMQLLYTHIHYEINNGAATAQLSFPDLGDLNNEVKSASATDNTLDIVFDLNGFDMLIHIEEKDGAWTGTTDLSTIGFHHEYTPKYISDQPDIKTHNFCIPPVHLHNLTENNEYTSLPCETILEYELNQADVLAYLKKKGICAENHHDLDTILSLMRQVTQLIQQDGVNYNHDREHRGTIAQIEHALNQDNKTNCRGIAIIMAGVLRAYGFKANIVTCFPISAEDPECHVVCETFVEELGKTILLDPSSNLLYYKNGVPLNLIELKAAIVKGEAEQLTINSDAIHGGEPVDKMQMIAYMSKNLFYLEKCIVSNEASEATEDNSICLAPASFFFNDLGKSYIYTTNLKAFYL